MEMEPSQLHFVSQLITSRTDGKEERPAPGAQSLVQSVLVG